MASTLPAVPVARPARNDVELLRRVTHALRESGHPALQKVRAVARNGRIVLQGHLASYYQKQLAQSAVMWVDGVDSVQNEIVVSR